jgi:hypothetical protein
MSGPLDDALGRHDRERDQQQRRQRDDHVKMKEFIADFLRRMQAAGNPGVTLLRHHLETYSLGSRGWDITYHCTCSGPRWRTLRIFSNGKITFHEPGNFEHYGPYRSGDLSSLGRHKDGITEGMAKVLRQNGVRLALIA